MLRNSTSPKYISQCVEPILVDMGEDYEAPGKDDSSNSSSSVYFGV